MINKLMIDVLGHESQSFATCNYIDADVGVVERRGYIL